jgi:Cdc6-like AAA superfamily ATPase
MRYFMSLAMDYSALSQMTGKLLHELATALPNTQGTPRERHLFAGAVTPAGLVNFYPSILQKTERLYLLTGDPGCGKSTLLKHVCDTVRQAGQDMEVYHCGFDAERLDAVVVPALKTAFVKVTYPHTFSLPPAHPVSEQYTIALSRYAKASTLRTSAAERTESQERFWYLLGKAVEMIRSAKRNHDELESYYIRAMDFEKITAVRERLLAELLPKTAPC